MNSLKSNFARKLPRNKKLHAKPVESYIQEDWSRAINHQFHIKRRTCTTFIPTKAKDRGPIRCGCKRLRREHSWETLEQNDTEWKRAEHTKEAFSNAYGRIPNTDAPYIRCDIQTDPKTLVKFMINTWKVKKPRLIMCIIGGAKYFKLSERLEREFMRGIIYAALKADGWIITTGYKTGVVQLVGEAIYDHKVTDPDSQITAIGCSKWGAVRNREQYVLRNSKITDLSEEEKDSTRNAKGQQYLEPNHSHFIFLDDGTYFGYEIGDYRTRFANEISKYRERNVPIVTIVVEGGPDTLYTIYKDLRSQIPIVLIDGSGRIPNLLVSFLARTEPLLNRYIKDPKSSNLSQEIDVTNEENINILVETFKIYENDIRDGLRDISKGSKTSDKEMNSLYHHFLYCLQPTVRTRFQVYNLDSERDLDDTIFEAIIKAKQAKSSKDDSSIRSSLLELAIPWDTIDLAKEYIIRDDLSDLPFDTKEKLFWKALLLDRPHFINAFIKSNFDVPKMFYEENINQPWKLRWEKLQNLYNNDSKTDTRLNLWKKSARNDGLRSEEDLDKLLKLLIGGYMKSIYTDASSNRFCFALCKSGSKRVHSSDRAQAHFSNSEINEDEIFTSEINRKEANERVYRDLFLWSILTNRIEMAKVFLSYMRTRICGALIASKVFKEYDNYATDNESKEVLRAQADSFEEYANEALKCCYNYDENKACEIAIRRINLFGGVSCLQVAVDADDKNFVGQPCCDEVLDYVWSDKLEPYQSSNLILLARFLSILSFGLLAPFLLKFRVHENDRRRENKWKRKLKTAAAGVNNNINNVRNEIGNNIRNNDDDDDDDDDTANDLYGIKKKFEEPLEKQSKKLDSHGINYSDVHEYGSSICSNILKYFHRVVLFHQSPFSKYYYNVASYIFFLLLFSYYLLFNFEPPADVVPIIHWTEILVIIIITTMLAEDIRQFICQDNRSIGGKFFNYFVKRTFSSTLRVISYSLFYIGLILRLIRTSDRENFAAAKIILAFDLEIWYIRSLSFLGIIQKMGPKIVMLRKMFVDLFFFTYIILIAMIGYGVASRSMYNYNNATDTPDLIFDGRSIFRNIIYPVYYLMYGAQDGELAALDKNADQAESIATQVLLAFHMLFVNILLINLLIAMFSYTFESVQTQTDLVWRYERYLLIREYFDRPPLFPPLIIISHFIELIKLIFRHSIKRKYKSSAKRTKAFKMIATSREVDEEWSEFESYATNFYARRAISTKSPSPGSSASPSSSISTTVRSDVLQPINDPNSIAQTPASSNLRDIAEDIGNVKKIIGELQNNSAEMYACIQWMMDAMERVRMSKDPKPRLKSATTTNN